VTHWKIARSTWSKPVQGSALKVPFSASAMALSYESATEPTDAEAPMSASRSVYRIDTYWASSTGRCNTGLL
jgi:hypothetical protein